MAEYGSFVPATRHADEAEMGRVWLLCYVGSSVSTYQA